VLKTNVGYAGGKKDKPTYRAIGDHTEALSVEFDPEVVMYEELLAIFWKEHDPYAGTWSTQYKAVLWTHGAAQAKAAKKAVEAIEKAHDGKKITTEVLPATTFWIAEDYHQKYYLRSRTRLLEALLPKKATDADVRDSTITARANGWVAGHGAAEEIAAEAKRLGLSGKALEELSRVLGKKAPVLCK
jgi:methionine-S-sulfoxide reductase